MEKTLTEEADLKTVSPETPAERASLVDLCEQYTKKYRELVPPPGQGNGESTNLIAQIESDDTLIRLAEKIKEHVVLDNPDQEFGLAEVKIVQQLLRNNQPIQTIRETIWSRNQR